MIAVITGVAGQDGSWMADLLLKEGWEVYGLARPCPRDKKDNLKLAITNPNFHLLEGDITNAHTIDMLVDLKPDHFYHFAAISHVRSSFNLPSLIMETNAGSTAMILERLWNKHNGCRFYHAGSSEMFPTNNGELSANSPYAASKVAAHLLTKVYRDMGMFAISCISYNHESSRRGREFVTMKIVEHAKKGIPVSLGNINSLRDWHHAEDTIKGIYKAMCYSTPIDFTFASGESHSIKNFIITVEDILNTTIDFSVNDPLFIRPNDVNYLIGNANRAWELLTWQPRSFKEMVEEMVNG